VHERTHMGERPFACDHPGCDKDFLTKGCLTVHKRTHTGEKPFACAHSGCGESFASKGERATHESTHAGERHSATNSPEDPAAALAKAGTGPEAMANDEAETAAPTAPTMHEVGALTVARQHEPSVARDLLACGVRFANCQEPLADDAVACQLLHMRRAAADNRRVPGYVACTVGGTAAKTYW